jgi:hypothetical protein
METDAIPLDQVLAMANSSRLERSGAEFTRAAQSGHVNAVGLGVAGPSTFGTKRPASASPDPERPTKRLSISDEIFDISQTGETVAMNAGELSRSFEDELRCVGFHVCYSFFTSERMLSWCARSAGPPALLPRVPLRLIWSSQLIQLCS